MKNRSEYPDEFPEVKYSELAEIIALVEQELKNAPQGNLETIKGEKVRSKSEVIIANLLTSHNIPYHYEYPVQELEFYETSFP